MRFRRDRGIILSEIILYVNCINSWKYISVELADQLSTKHHLFIVVSYNVLLQTNGFCRGSRNPHPRMYRFIHLYILTNINVYKYKYIAWFTVYLRRHTSKSFVIDFADTVSSLRANISLYLANIVALMITTIVIYYFKKLFIIVKH